MVALGSAILGGFSIQSTKPKTERLPSKLRKNLIERWAVTTVKKIRFQILTLCKYIFL